MYKAYPITFILCLIIGISDQGFSSYNNPFGSPYKWDDFLLFGPQGKLLAKDTKVPVEIRRGIFLPPNYIEPVQQHVQPLPQPMLLIQPPVHQQRQQAHPFRPNQILMEEVDEEARDIPCELIDEEDDEEEYIEEIPRKKKKAVIKKKRKRKASFEEGEEENTSHSEEGKKKKKCARRKKFHTVRLGSEKFVYGNPSAYIKILTYINSRKTIDEIKTEFHEVKEIRLNYVHYLSKLERDGFVSLIKTDIADHKSIRAAVITGLGKKALVKLKALLPSDSSTSLESAQE